MNFRTIVPIQSTITKLSHGQTCVMLGSCFTENIGERLQNTKFSVDLNPFGILYNPLSIEQALFRLIDEKLFDQEDLFQNESRWHSFMHHSRFSKADVDECLNGINNRMLKSGKKLQKADFLFITFGTAWLYELKESGKVVSNCHKLPDSLFIRRRLTVEDLVQRYSILIKKLQENNPKLQLVFTVSPIRHWKDGAHENQLSKSILLLAIDALSKQFDNVSYFPAYELVMDDLRDYRFYTEDMQHPNKTAIDYIWERFSETYFNAETQRTSVEMEKLTRALSHRPYYMEGEEYKKFCEQQLNKIKKFELAYPEIDFSEEKEMINNNL